jgi:hypothetical protein
VKRCRSEASPTRGGSDEELLAEASVLRDLKSLSIVRLIYRFLPLSSPLWEIPTAESGGYLSCVLSMGEG